jgi:hypothetical protein
MSVNFTPEHTTFGTRVGDRVAKAVRSARRRSRKVLNTAEYALTLRAVHEHQTVIANRVRALIGNEQVSTCDLFKYHAFALSFDKLIRQYAGGQIPLHMIGHQFGKWTARGCRQHILVSIVRNALRYRLDLGIADEKPPHGGGLPMA